jgi:hypothetical protein
LRYNYWEKLCEVLDRNEKDPGEVIKVLNYLIELRFQDEEEGKEFVKGLREGGAKNITRESKGSYRLWLTRPWSCISSGSEAIVPSPTKPF